MALKEKSAVFQVRIDPDLHARFKIACEDRDMTVSEMVRRFIVHQVELAEGTKYVSRRATVFSESLQPSSAVLSSAPSVGASPPVKSPPVPVKSPTAAVGSRKQRREAEQEARRDAKFDKKQGL